MGGRVHPTATGGSGEVSIGLCSPCLQSIAGGWEYEGGKGGEGEKRRLK